jgi:hypothetical protein
MKHLFIFTLFVIAFQVNAQNNEIIRKTSDCKIVKEWLTDTLREEVRVYNTEFSASEQNACGNLVLSIYFFKSKDSRLDDKILNIELKRKTTNNENYECAFSTIYTTAYSNIDVTRDGLIITHSKLQDSIEIKEVFPKKFRLTKLVLTKPTKKNIFTYKYSDKFNYYLKSPITYVNYFKDDTTWTLTFNASELKIKNSKTFKTFKIIDILYNYDKNKYQIKLGDANGKYSYNLFVFCSYFSNYGNPILKTANYYNIKISSLDDSKIYYSFSDALIVEPPK